MISKRLLAAGTLFCAVLLIGSSAVQAQAAGKGAANETKAATEVRSSAAYAEIVLRRADVLAEVESLTADYTDDYPKVVESRYLLELLDKEKARLQAIKPGEAGKLTLALGKLMVKKVDLELDLWVLRKTLQDAHPDVRRAKRKLDVYEAAIKEILG